MKGILGTLLLLMIAASVEANSSANDTATAAQDSGLEGELAASVGQSEPNMVACQPFCFPGLGRKRESQAAALGAEGTQDPKVQRRFEPESRWLIVGKSDSTSSTIPRLIGRKRQAFKRQQQMQAQQIRKDRESMASYKRGVRNQYLRVRLQ